MNAKLIYGIIKDDFEGNVETFIQEKQIKVEDIENVVNEMAENSDGGMCYYPLYLVAPNGAVLQRWKE